MTDATASSSTGGLSGWFANNRVLSGRILVLVGVAIAGLAAYLSYQAGAWTRGETALPSNMPMLLTSVWALWTALSFIGCGMWQLSSEPSEERRPLLGRAVLLSLTGLVGAGVFFLGFALMYSWADTLTKLLREGDREGAWRVLLAIAASIAGLAIMFAGLQAARADERQVVGIRRYIYGFNAFLTGFLLLSVLVVINVLAFMRLPTTIDATSSGAFSLADRSKQVLAQLDQPVTIYVILSDRWDFFSETKSLLSLIAEHTPRLTIEYLSTMDEAALQKLAKKFPRFAVDGQGLLIAINDDPTKTTFISANDLVKSDFDQMSGGRGTEQFLGEQKVINELTFLTAGKEKPVIYVTQGNGEPDLTDTRKPEGLGILRERLQRRYFEVRPLRLEPISPKVPDDAKIVIIAGPTQPYAQSTADALKAFVDQGGKVIVMADVVEVGRGVKEMPATGLEGLMTSYGVDITRERIYSILFMGSQVIGSEQVVAIVDPKAGNNPIVAPFKTERFQFVSCRVIRPIADFQNPAVRVQTLLSSVLSNQIRFFTESDMQADVEQTINRMIKDEKEAEKRLAREPLPVMMAVSESPRGMPGAPPQPEKPKMVVFGDVTFVANRSAVSRDAVEFDLFIGAVEWLRERPANIGIEPHSFKYYEMDRIVSDPGYVERLRFIPLFAACLAVLGLGIGVWLVRRQ